MKNFLDIRLAGLRDALFHHQQDRQSGNASVTAVQNAIESVIDGTDSKIRLVHGYRKKLGNTIRSSLEFSDDLVNQIPEPVDVNSSTFTSDPYVNAFFTNVGDLQSVFSHSSEIQEYMAESRDDDGRCCALLCMRRSEKTVMGMELTGDMLHKDVLQVAVNFSDHRIYSPAPSESETREGLKSCLFQGLVTNALERIMKLRLANHRLQGRHRILHAKLRRQKQKLAETGQNNDSGNNLVRALEETSLELEKTREQILNTPLMTPQAALEQVIDVFSRPEKFVSARKVPLRLNKMCIKVSDDAPGPANNLNLTEVIIGNELPRVVTLARFPRKELLARTVFPAVQNPATVSS